MPLLQFSFGLAAVASAVLALLQWSPMQLFERPGWFFWLCVSMCCLVLCLTAGIT